MRTLMVFVDGLGLGETDPRINPVHSGCAPHLEAFLDEDSIPLDARLDTPGRPQSATGQTAILTGLNAAQAVGRHVEGFPGDALKDIIRRHNIYARLSALRLTSTFANAYFADGAAEVAAGWIQSVTTVAALSAFGSIRDKAFLARNEAVYHDLTRERLVERGYGGPIITPAEAAAHLLRMADGFDFTLFEYFMTDRVGHKADMDAAVSVLSVLDPFLGRLIAAARQGRCLLVLTSDHGNVEDIRIRTHTMNPVPLAAVGPAAELVKTGARSITDIVPALLRVCALPSD